MMAGPGGSRRRTVPGILWAGLTLVAMGSAATGAAATPNSDGPDTSDSPPRALLVVVNGDSITTSDLDKLLISTHRTMSVDRRADFDYTKLLDKLINDRLILQEAEAIGLDEEPEIREQLEKSRRDYAVSLYVSRSFSPPDSASEAELRAFFERYYWKIQVRQITVRTFEQARDVRRQIRAGVSMDSLARAISLDPYQPRGGLHNLIYWADLENLLRGQVAGLEAGEVTPPFPNAQAFTVARVEQKTAVVDSAWAGLRSTVRSFVLAEKKKRAWRAFLDHRRAQVPVVRHEAVLAKIAADSSLILDGAFRNGSSDPALEADGTHVVDEGELRVAVSHKKMKGASRAFHDLLGEATEEGIDRLVLEVMAEREGYLDSTRVRTRYERERADALIQAYLTETIAPKIRFNHGEFQEYYENHREDFREPEEVLLETLSLTSEEKANEVADRLDTGASFELVRKLYLPETDSAPEPRWTPISIFSDDIRAALDEMKPGESTRPFGISGGGWAIFHLDARRPGRLKTIDEVDSQIRAVMFQRKFDAALGEFLAKLKKRSDIRRNEAAIAAYFRPR